jgi:RHS repeat-associated protein
VGRLTKDEDPAGGALTLARTLTATGVRVTLTTKLGKSTTYDSARLADDSVLHTRTGPTGAVNTALELTDGTEVITGADGSTVTLVPAPDPRWGMQSPMLGTATLRLPSGRTAVLTHTRTVVMPNPLDPLHITTLQDVLARDGTAETTTFTSSGGTRTITTRGPSGRQVSRTIDASGHLLSLVPATGIDPVTFTYDPEGRVTAIHQGAESWTYQYDVLGRPVSRTNALGHVTSYQHDADGRITRITSDEGRITRYAYDQRGDLASVTLPGGAVHTLGSTSVGQLSSYDPPPAGSPHAWAYDGDHALTSFTMPSGGSVVQGYDAGKRVASIADGSLTATFGYADATDRATTMTSTPQAGAAVTEATSYDGALPTSTAWSGPATGTFTYTYGTRLLLSDITLTAGADTVDLALSRDNDGALAQEGAFSLTRTGPGGLVSQLSQGSFAETVTYDGGGRRSVIRQTLSGNQKYRLDLTYDAGGRTTLRVEAVGATSHQYDYAYDDDGRLTDVSQDGSAVEHYVYDADGNRTTRVVDGVSQTATYDAQDRIIQQGTESYQFDADGFLSSRTGPGGTDTFTYGRRGELLSGNVGGQAVSYAYDALGRRVARTDPGGTVQYLYGNPSDPFQVTAARDAAGQLWVLHYDDAGFLYAMEHGATKLYVAADQVGSPRVVTDGAGNIARAIDYDSYGGIRSDSNPSLFLPIGFAGGLSDPVTGLVRFGLRDYDPGTGRWTARDPFLFRSGQANLYEYVGDSPVSNRDPLGLLCVGAEAYDIVGGGARVCISDQGFSLCSELGVGWGEEIQVDPFANLDDRGVALEDEVAVKWGPIGVGLEGSIPFDPCKDSVLNARAIFGPVSLEVPSGDPRLGGAPDELNHSLKDLFAQTGFTAEAALKLKFCERIP